MANKGSVAKMIKMKIADGINILFEHKSIDCLDHFKSYMWTKNVHMHMCVHVHIYMHIWTKHIHMCKNMKIFMCAYGHICCAYIKQMHLGTCVYVNVDMCINIACVHSYPYVSI